MKADQSKPVDLSISSAEFDRLMRKALQVAPEQAPQPKPPAKVTKARKPAKKAQPK